jgi:cohesin loading factor subunit SCC2
MWTEWESACPDFLDELYFKHVDPEDDGSVPKQAATTSSTKRKKDADGIKASQFSSKRRRQAGDPKAGTLVDSMKSLLEPGQPNGQESSREDAAAALIMILNDFIDRGRAAPAVDQVSMEMSQFSTIMSVGVEKLRSMSRLDVVPAELFREAFALIVPCIHECTKKLKGDVPETPDQNKAAQLDCMMRYVLLILAVASGKREESTSAQVCNETTLEACTAFLEAFLTKRILAPMDALLSEQAKQLAEQPKATKKLRLEQDAALNEVASRSSPICQGAIMLNDILHIHHVQDKELLRAASICMSAFFHDGAEHLHVLQSVSIPLMQSIFALYETHRQNMLNEIFARISTWQFVGRKERCFRLQASANSHVQMLSALLLALFQACNSPPPQVEALQIAGNLASLNASTSATINKTKPALPLLLGFIKKFLNKFAEAEKAGKKQDRDTSSAHKRFLEVFCEDVCAMLGLPEFPITSLAQRALWKLAYETSTSDKYHMTYRTMATDMLGGIILSLKKHSMQVPVFLKDVSQPNPFFNAAGDGPSKESSSDATVASSLGEVDTYKQLLDQLQGLLRRVGTEILEESLGKEWRGEGRDEMAAREHVYALYCKQLLLNYLTASCVKSEKALCHARHAYLSDWCDEASNSDVIMLCWCAQWEPPSQSSASSLALPSPAQASELARYILIVGSLQKGFNYILSPLLVLLKHGNQAIRQKALKAFSRIVEADPWTLRQEAVRSGVCNLMSDVSTSVRATAVSLVGNYMHTNKDVMTQYFESICERCRDTGTSVRKTAMNILKDCLATEHSNSSIVERACVAMVPLLRDESQDIRTRASAILKDMWFPPVSADNKRGSNASAKRASIEARFDQIKGVVTSAHSSTLVDRDRLTVLDVLEHFFREAMREDVGKERMCREYCEYGVQVVIREHEDRAGTHTASELEKVHLQLFHTLALFAKANPQLLVKQAHLLHQYLTGQEDNSQQWTGDQCSLTGTVASIYNCVLPHMKPLPPTLIKYLQADLPKLIRFAPKMPLIISSIQCLCTLSKSVGQSQSNMTTQTLALLSRFFQHNFAALSQPNDKAKPRPLIICGLLCRYSKFKLTLPASGAEGTSKVTAIEDAYVSQLHQACIRYSAVRAPASLIFFAWYHTWSPSWCAVRCWQ